MQTKVRNSGLFGLVLLFLGAIGFGARGEEGVGVFEGKGDVGTVLHAGAVEFDSGKKSFLISGSGENMWAAKDAFQFLWKKASGDLAVSADVSFLGAGTDPHRKACLMIRQSLDADSAYVDVALHGDGLTSLQFRDAKGAATHEVQANVKGPARLRLEKRGKYARMWLAGEGQEFSYSGAAVRIELEGAFYVGLGVCAHNKDLVEKAVFSRVEIQTEFAAATGKPVLYSSLETQAIGSTDRRVTLVTEGKIESPSWADDGMSLIYRSGEKIYRVAALGGKPEAIDAESVRRLSRAKVANDGRESSPDGKFIYFNSDRTGTMQIWRMKADGSEQEQVTNDDLNNWFPHVSPDGKKMVFLSYEKDVSGHPENKDVTLRMMTLEGKQVVVLGKMLGGQGTINVPCWSGDGKKIAFVSYQMIP